MHPLSHFHYKRIHSPSGPCGSPTVSTPTPDPTHCVICQRRVPTRDSGTQLARGINWIQSSSLQAKKMSHPTPEQMEFCSLRCPFHPISQPSPLLPSPLPQSPSGAARGHASQHRLGTPKREGLTLETELRLL